MTAGIKIYNNDGTLKLALTDTISRFIGQVTGNGQVLLPYPNGNYFHFFYDNRPGQTISQVDYYYTNVVYSATVAQITAPPNVITVIGAY